MSYSSIFKFFFETFQLQDFVPFVANVTSALPGIKLLLIEKLEKKMFRPLELEVPPLTKLGLKYSFLI